MSKSTRFRPYMPGSKFTQPALRERIVNFKRVTARQRKLLIDTAADLLRAGREPSFDSVREAAPALELPDVMPMKWQEAANDVRQQGLHPTLPGLADLLDAIGGVPADVIARRRAERQHEAACRLLRPLGYQDITAPAEAGTDRMTALPCWRRSREDGSEILITPDKPDADVADDAWVAVLFDSHSNRIGDSGALMPLRRLLDRIVFIRREVSK